ncbi:MAG TPA: DNA polymerase III subunit gamma/tau [Verrucomicrobiae bacterium]|jgi:DNA polymerase-3 subunit gamma/tau
MSYQVIARKYRPQRFSDVVGQEHVTQTLSNAIAQSRIAHAYLFCGPRGTGKTTIARIFAKCLNCTDGPKVDFAEDDPRCQEIAEGRSLDVLEIDGASHRGIEEIRELRETVKYAPASGKFKIYIIDEVHMLTKEAFNALLKTLEEPPAHVKFMFATTEPEKVLTTILSRCQRFDLRRIPVGLIVKHLGQIAKNENVKIEDAALFAVGRGAEGGMRDAESALDQLISFCGTSIREEDVLSMFGLTAQKQILSLSESILKGDSETLLRELDDLTRHGKDLGRLLSDVLNFLRNVLIFQISKGDSKWLELSEAEASRVGEVAKQTSTEGLTRIMEVLTDAEGRMRDAASKKIFLEVTFLKAMQARNSVSIETVLKKLNELKSSEAGVAPSPARKASSSVVAAPIEHARAEATAAAVASSSLQLSETPGPVAAVAGDLQGLWQSVSEAVGRASPFVKTYLLQAHLVSFEKNVFTIGFDPEFEDQIGLVDVSKNHELIKTKLKEIGHANAQIKFVVAEAPAHLRKVPAAPAQATPTKAPTAANPQPPTPAASGSTGSARLDKAAAAPMNVEEFKNDPLIKKALEIFKGQIVEVRA